jgi:hypothetical protein
MNRGADVVPKSRERQLGGAGPAADRLLRLENEDRSARFRERDGSRKAVRPRTDDDRVRRL